MNKTQKIAFVALTIAVLPVLALAQGGIPGVPAIQTNKVGDITGLISNLVNKVWMVFAALAVIMFVYAGVKFLLAAGNPEKIAEARTAALWGVIGVVVMILAFSIFNIASTLIG